MEIHGADGWIVDPLRSASPRDGLCQDTGLGRRWALLPRGPNDKILNIKKEIAAASIYVISTVIYMP